MSNPSKIHVGSDALGGKEESIVAHIFEASDEERWLEGRGKLIMIIHPSDPKKTIPYDDVKENAKILVPPKHRVKVIGAHVALTPVLR